MSIATEITRLQGAKADLKTAIENKGVTVSSSALLDAYPALVDSIPSGEKLYTEWPSDAPNIATLEAAANAWISSHQFSATNGAQYIIFKGNQIDDIYLYGRQNSTLYIYYSDTEEEETTTHPNAGWVNLSHHTWSSSEGYHWIFLAFDNAVVEPSGFRNYTFFYSFSTYTSAQQNPDGNFLYYGVDENGDVYAPDGKGFLSRISAVCSINTSNIFPSEYKTFRILRKLPLIYGGSFSTSSTKFTAQSLCYSDTLNEVTAYSLNGGNLPDALTTIKAKKLLIRDSSFSGMTALKKLDCELGIGANITNINGAFTQTRIEEIAMPNTSNVTVMSNLFKDSYIKTPPTMNTSNVVSMNGVFNNCYNLRSYPSYDYSNATTLSELFYNCYNASGSCVIDAPLCTTLYGCFMNNKSCSSVSLDTPSNTNLTYAFYGCNKILSVIFASGSSSKVTNYNGAFSDCNNLQSLSALCTSNATAASNYQSMFYKCTSLTTLGTEQVTDKDGNTVNSWIFNYAVDLGYSPLNLASIKHVMENLKSGVSSQTFKLSKTSKQYLEAEPATDGTSANLWEQLSAEAASKGWTVSVNNSY